MLLSPVSPLADVVNYVLNHFGSRTKAEVGAGVAVSGRGLYKTRTMTEVIPKATHLETRYVFLDTQAVRQEKLDWTGKRLGRLRELGKVGQVIILTTSITKREISHQIIELLEEARKAVSKSHAVLGQIGQGSAI